MTRNFAAIALVDPKGASPLPRDALNDLRENRGKVVTPAGKALIELRLTEEKAFLDALRRETDNFSAF